MVSVLLQPGAEMHSRTAPHIWSCWPSFNSDWNTTQGMTVGHRGNNSRSISNQSFLFSAVLIVRAMLPEIVAPLNDCSEKW